MLCVTEQALGSPVSLLLKWMALWVACIFHIFPALCLGLLPGTRLSLQTGCPRSPTFEQMVGSWMAPNGCPLSVFWNQYCLKLFSFFFFSLFSPAVGKDFSPPRITPAGLCHESLQIRMDFNVMKPQHAAATSPPGRPCPAI